MMMIYRFKKGAKNEYRFTKFSWWSVARKVMENMQDVNTPYKDKRQIVITMTFVQNEQRDNVLADISVKEKLAAQGGLTTQFAVGKDLRSGEIVAEEYGKQLRGQLNIEDMEKIDTETGEVIDIRKVKGE